MKKSRLLTTLLSIATFFGSFASCKTFEPYELTLTTFNIRTMASSDVGVKAWENRREAVVAFINDSGADIIGLQEVTLTQFVYIYQKIASNYEALHFPRQSGGNPEGVAFVYDKTVFNLVSQEKYWLSETPDEMSKGWDETYYRVAAVLTLEHIQTGERIKAINTHGPLAAAANEKAFELIASRSLSGKNEPFTVMMGDFNATPNKLGYVPIAEKLQDCRVSAQESSNRDNATFTNWGKETPGRIIDYCFVSKGENVQVLSYQVRDERWGDGNYISDHFAVQTTVRIEKSERGV